jgi:hypothetical protein
VARLLHPSPKAVSQLVRGRYRSFVMLGGHRRFAADVGGGTAGLDRVRRVLETSPATPRMGEEVSVSGAMKLPKPCQAVSAASRRSPARASGRVSTGRGVTGRSPHR